MPTSKSSGDSNSKRGFASMDEKKQREIASKGGKASHGDSNSKSSSTKGGTSEQHAKSGSQSHKKS
ncbi:MAG: KGG domain-containing protein [Pseudomonadota bacterium]|nr:KGG domain-containing protein [Pseudomonadota bacterium]